MFILSYKTLTSEGFVGGNLGAVLDRDQARAVCEDFMRLKYKAEGEVAGMFFLEEVNKDGSLRNPVEFVVELNEHEVEFLTDKFKKAVDAARDLNAEEIYNSMIIDLEDM